MHPLSNHHTRPHSEGLIVISNEPESVIFHMKERPLCLVSYCVFGASFLLQRLLIQDWLLKHYECITMTDCFSICHKLFFIKIILITWLVCFEYFENYLIIDFSVSLHGIFICLSPVEAVILLWVRSALFCTGIPQLFLMNQTKPA